MSRQQKKTLYRIIISFILLLAVHFLPLHGGMAAIAYLLPYAIIGWDVLWRALRNIRHGQIFDENFLMALATVGAFGSGEYAEASAVMLFYQVGELFQSYAVGKSRKSIASLMDIRPDYANIETEAGLTQVDPEDVQVGDCIVIKPGERVPLDGIVTRGTSALDTAALTGEAIPRDVMEGDCVISGCVNLSGLIYVKVSKAYTESTVSKILELVENASEKKAKTENFITKFARYYTPAVVIAAVLLAVLPPLFYGDWAAWLHRALIFLVVSCPCALVISVPLSFFGGIGGASKRGILVKGSNYLEALSHAEIVVFDKTGTLTKGTFCVSAIHPEPAFTDTLLEYAALAEIYSDHPISLSLQKSYQQPLDKSRVSQVQELAGYGISARVDDATVYAGNTRLMDKIGCTPRPCEVVGTIVHIAVNGTYAGHIVISDVIKEESAAAIQALKAAGVKRTVMLTGDGEAVAKDVAQKLGLDEYYAGLLPEDKVSAVERLIHEKSKNGMLAFVGDGINDAPVLSRADIGIAMGAMGTDAAIEAADIVLMDDNIQKIASAMRIARKTLQIATQNIVFALVIKGGVLLLTALGHATMWEAVFADVGVAFIAILNATRALHTEKL